MHCQSGLLRRGLQDLSQDMLSCIPCLAVTVSHSQQKKRRALGACCRQALQDQKGLVPRTQQWTVHRNIMTGARMMQLA